MMFYVHSLSTISFTSKCHLTVNQFFFSGHNMKLLIFVDAVRCKPLWLSFFLNAPVASLDHS